MNAKKRLAIYGGALLMLGATSVAGTTDFRPSIAADTTYSDNLEYSGTGSSSDAAYRLSLDLPVTRSWTTGQMLFRYNPRRNQFRDQGALDHTAHFVSFAIDDQLSEKDGLNFSATFLRSQTQGNFFSLDDPDILLTERVFRDRLDADLGYSRQLGPTWNWTGSVGIGSVQHETIDGFTSGGGGTTFEDRTQLRFATTLGKQISQTTNVGVNVRFQQNELDISGDEDVTAVNFSFNRQISAVTSFAVLVGLFDAETDLGINDRSGAFVRASYNRDFRNLAIGLFGGHRPTSGGSLPGTATDTNVGVSLTGTTSPTWNWDLSVSAARRDPAESAAPEIESTGIAGSVNWAIHPNVGLRLRAANIQQSVDAPMTTDIDVFNVSFGVAWFPRGQQQQQRTN